MMSQYHQSTLGLLSREPTVSIDEIRKLETFEDKWKVKLPISIREWYLFNNAVKLLADLCDGPAHSIENWKIVSSPIGSLIVIVTENQNNWDWAFLLDGSDDPPVFVTDMDGKELWHLNVDSFSKFVYSKAWDRSVIWGAAYLWVDTKGITNDDLKFMRAYFTESVATFQEPGIQNYRFYNEFGRITINDKPYHSNDYTRWWFRGISPDVIFELVQPIYEYWQHIYKRGDITYFYGPVANDQKWGVIYAFLRELMVR